MGLRLREWMLLGVVCVGVGCRAKRYAAEADASGPMPANTVMLSAMMRELSAKPGFTEAFLKQVQGGGNKAGAALLTPTLVDHLRDQILGRNWQGLDRFPGWTMREINPTVRVVGHVAGRDEKVESTATAGGAPSGQPGEAAARQAARKAALAYVDLGDYTPERGGVESLDEPSRGKGFAVKDYVAAVGDGVVRGDGPNPDRAPRHAESARLAELLNRLSLNGQQGVAGFAVELEGQRVTTPEALMEALAGTGHQVMVADSRYFANFGHLHFRGQDVMMPFWVNSQILVPGTKRPLLVPVSHAEYEWFVRGPKVNAEVSFYFGIDGKAEFRTMDQMDQPWVMNHHAHEYGGAEMREVTRLSGEMVRTYLHLHQAHPAIPFGGYYAFGVCQDVVAAIELKETGRTTLFPNTADARFFTDGRDAEINELIKRIPKDRDGKAPEPERIFGSLPVGTTEGELRSVSIPGLGADLASAHQAWTDGTLERVQTGWRRWLRSAWIPVLLLAVGGVWFVARRRHIPLR